MTASAIARGARCAVVNGGLRDTIQVLKQDFPIFYRYRSSNGSLGRTKITGYNIPVRIGKVYIKPGDVIFGVDGYDANDGMRALNVVSKLVVAIPRSIAYDVLLRAEAIKQQEREMRTWVHEGFSAQEMVKNGGYF